MVIQVVFLEFSIALRVTQALSAAALRSIASCFLVMFAFDAGLNLSCFIVFSFVCVYFSYGLRSIGYSGGNVKRFFRFKSLRESLFFRYPIIILIESVSSCASFSISLGLYPSSVRNFLRIF